MSQDLPQIRIASRQDEEELMAMCHRLWEENGLFSFAEDKVRSCLHRCYDRQGVIVGVIGESGSIQASTCLAMSDFYYSHDWHLAELWNFVDAQYRKSRNIEALIEFGKSCAMKMGIPFFTGIITNKRMAGKVRAYRRLLGHPSGAFFIYNANWQSEPMEDHRDLSGKLRELAMVCNNSKAPMSKHQIGELLRNKIGPLLREAAETLKSEDNLWGPVKASDKPDSAAHVEGSG